MCDYCREPNGLFLTDGLFEQCRIECLSDVNLKKKRYTLCVNNSAWKEIKYCPICGRELK
jgi:hypothetical protein